MTSREKHSNEENRNSRTRVPQRGNQLLRVRGTLGEERTSTSNASLRRNQNLKDKAAPRKET